MNHLTCQALMRCIGVLLVFALGACSQQSGENETKGTENTQGNEHLQPIELTETKGDETAAKLAAELTTLIQNKYSISLHETKKLQQALLEFIGKASPKSLENALTHWRSAHTSFRVAALSQELGIEHPVLDRFLSEPEMHHPIMARIDQQPMIGGYLDAVPGYPRSGLIYSEVELSLEQLNQEHQLGDPAYVAMGFHALEFLLKGDPSEEAARYTAFLPQSPEDKTAAARRARYVKILSQQLVYDITLLANEWSYPEGFYPQYLQTRTKKWFQTTGDKLALAQKANEPDSASHAPENFVRMRNTFLSEMVSAIENVETPSDKAGLSTKSTSNTESPE